MLNAIIILGIMGCMLGLGLALASKFFYVKVDTRIEDITKMLPGYNCGACGYPGCAGFADAIVNNTADKLSSCKPGKPDKNFHAILDYLKENPNEDGSINKIKI